MAGHRALPAATLLAGLAACAGPTGPVVGDWRGETPGPVQFYGQVVELVLDGTPDAPSGRYRLAVTVQNPLQLVGNESQRWGGTWTRETAPDGRSVFVLHDDLPGQVNRYEWAADGTLRALPPDHLPDTRTGAGLYTLFPVPHGYGYGRL